MGTAAVDVKKVSRKVGGSVRKVYIRPRQYVRTRNIKETLEKLFAKDIPEVAIALEPPYSGYVYVNADDFDRLVAGEKVRLTVTNVPWGGGMNLVEAWSWATFRLEDL